MKAVYLYKDPNNQNSTEESFLSARQIQEISKESFLDSINRDLLVTNSNLNVEEYCSEIQEYFKDLHEKLYALKEKQESEDEFIKKIKQNYDFLSNYDNIFLEKEEDLDRKISLIEQKLSKRQQKAIFSKIDISLSTSEGKNNSIPIRYQPFSTYTKRQKMPNQSHDKGHRTPGFMPNQWGSIAQSSPGQGPQSLFYKKT